MTLANAQAWCNGEKGTLPIPESAAENEFLASLGSTWLGFLTTDMTGLTFTHWRSDEPSGDSTEVQLIAEEQKFGHTWDGRWNDGSSDWPATCYVSDLADCNTWVEIYSQTGPSRFAKDDCTLADCNVYVDDENFIDFNQFDDVGEYHFKIVWDEGQSQLEFEF